MGPPEPAYGGRQVLRLHLRSTMEHVDHGEQESSCLADDGWAGVGWGCWDDPREVLSWAEYQAAKQASGEAVNASVRRLHDAPVGTLVWSRRRDGSYWLGELTGGWEYRGTGEARRIDLFNVRPCRWVLVGTEAAVPGKIVNNFRGPVAVNPVKDAAAVEYTLRLHVQLTGQTLTTQPRDPEQVIRSLLGPDDVEDLVAVYLQAQHDLLLVSRGRTTPGYEYVLRHRVTGRHAVASVKSGATPVDLNLLPESQTIDAFYYSVSGRTCGQRKSNAREITTRELVDFMNQRRAVLPDRVAYWLG